MLGPGLERKVNQMPESLSCSFLCAWWNASIFCDANSNLFLPNSRSATGFSFLPWWGADLTCRYAFYKILIYNNFLMSYVRVAAGMILLISGPVKQNG